MADILLNNDCIIRGSFLSQKTGLRGANDVGKKGLNPGSYDLSDDFILGIAKPNGSDVLESCGISALRDEAEVGRINSGINRIRSESILAKLHYRRAQGVPKFLVHKGM